MQPTAFHAATLALQRVLACLLLAAFLPGFASAQVIINEVMADNSSYVRDLEGNYPDWVELYNAYSTNVNISGWTMSDSPTTNKYTFPANTIIGAQSYLMVFCDNATNLAGFHTRFGLGRKGAYLNLRDGGGLLRDLVSFGFQVSDLSIGRYPNGTNGLFRLNVPTPGLSNLPYFIGPTNLVKINEWAATNNPSGTNLGKDWIELYNPSTNAVSIGGLVLSDRTPPAVFNRPITNLSFIGGGEFVRFYANDGKDPDELDFQLSSTSGELLSLYQTNKTTVIDQVNFPGNNTVPGYWIGECSYGRLPDGGTNIIFFNTNRTTPGNSNFQPLKSLLVNEVLAHTDLPLEDAVEFYNPWPTNVDIGGWWLSNEKANRFKFRIPFGTVVPAFGYRMFYEMVGSSGGFNTNSASPRCFTYNSANGDSVVLTEALSDTNGTVTGYDLVEKFDATQNGVSLGRYLTSDGNKEFVPMSSLSFGTSITAYDPPTVGNRAIFRTGTGVTNPYPMVGPVLINEVYYHPPDILEVTNILGMNFTNRIDDSTNEFIEVFNPNSTNVPLFDPAPFGTYFESGFGVYADGRTNTWRVRGNIDFDFPTNVIMSPGERLLLVNFAPTNAAMSNAFRSKFTIPTDVRIFGPYQGKLSNKDGDFELRKPDPPQGPSHPDFRYVPYILVERLHYRDSAPWPTNADGAGLSLHRFSNTGFANDPTNWVENAPSPGVGPAAPPSNAPPVLAAIGDKDITLGLTLTFTASATDTNVPTQALTYTLDAGAPSGASINPTNGNFVWTPISNQAPGNYPVTVRVTDDGSPVLNDFETITIRVWLPASVSVTPGAQPNRMNLAFSTIAGKHYRIVYKHQFSDLEWTTLVNSVTGTGSTYTHEDDTTGVDQRFYRLIHLD